MSSSYLLGKELTIAHNDGTVIESRARHDFVSYKDKNGRTYAVDGGHEYTRRGFEGCRDYEDISVPATAPFEQIREAFSWGTYGKSGKDPLKYVLIKDMESGHIQKILDSGQVKGSIVEKWFKEELRWRALDELTGESQKLGLYEH